jgi:hypothetical protein
VFTKQDRAGDFPLPSSITSHLAHFAVAILMVTSSARGDVLASYDGALGGLPHDSDCWQFVAGGPAPVNQDGAGTLGRTTMPLTTYWINSLPPISFDDGASIAASVKVISSNYYQDGTYKRSGYYIQLGDQTGRWAGLGISADRVLLMTADQNSFDQTALFNTTTAFNDYALFFSGNTVQATINGDVVLTAAVGIVGAGSSLAYVGDLSILSASQTLTANITVEGVADCDAADLTCDGIVDGADLGLLLGAWGAADCLADLNHDGSVDGADLGLLLAAWG